MQLLKPGPLSPLVEDLYQVTAFFENKSSQFLLFCKETNKIQGSTMQLLRTLKPFEVKQDIYYHNIASTIFCHAVEALVEACQINSITNQILQLISKKQRKRKETCVINSKARKTNLFNTTCERS